MIKIILFLIIGLLIGSLLGGVITIKANEFIMKDYDLYICIYNNSANNLFPDDPVLIQKIQDECICFREHNYTDLSGVDCNEVTP